MQTAPALSPLYDQATALLRNRILEGDLAPGSRIREVELAEELGISRGTLRASLQQLVFEGLVVQHKFRSSFVASLTPRDAYETYTLRNTLEAMAARIVASRIDESGRVRLREALGRMEAAALAGDRKRMVEADFGIHNCLFELTDHQRLQSQYRLLEAQTKLYLRLTASMDYDPVAIHEIHRRLVHAIVEGDAELAESLAKDHNTQDGEQMVSMLKGQEASRS